MQRFFRISLVLLILAACFSNIYGQNRDVILCLDESGSMHGQKFQNLVYAIQLTASLLDKSDRLYVIRGGGTQTIEIDLTNKKNEINDKIKTILYPNGAAECGVLVPAYRLLQKDQSREKILLIYGDGAWGNCGVEAKIVRDFEKIKPKIAFFKIEETSSVNGISNLERHLSGLPPTGFQVYRNPAHDLDKIKENLFKLSKTLIDADPAKVKPVISSQTIEFTPQFPLKKLLFIIQKDNCEVSSTSLNIQDGIELSNFDMGGNLTGRYYEIASANKKILPAKVPIKIKLNCAVRPADIEIIPIVAMDLKTIVEGNFLESDTLKKEYTLCDREKEVQLKTFLTDDKGKKINLAALSGIKLSVSNGTNQQRLTISGHEATGSIAIPDETTYLTVEAQYEGYFQKKSRIITVQKEECPLELDVDIQGDIKYQDTINRIIEICEHVESLEVLAKIKNSKEIIQDFSKLGTVEIKINTGTRTVPLENHSAVASGSLSIAREVTEATLTLHIDGKLEYKSPIYTIQRVQCGPVRDTTTLDMGEMPVMNFVQTGRCIDQVSLAIIGTNTIVHPDDYELSITGVPPELELTMESDGQFFRICIRKRTYLCDCFVRHGTFGGTIIAIPKDSEAFIGVKKDWQFTIVPESNFFIRCKTCLIIAFLLGLTTWYLYGIWTKPRFHSMARFDWIEEDRTRRYGSPPEDEFFLKTKSFFNRYLVPYWPEQKTIGDDNLLIIASERKDMVYLSKKSFVEKMKVNGAKIEEDAQRDEVIGENDTIRIRKSNAVTAKYTFQIN